MLWRAAEEQRVVLAAAMAQVEGKRAHARRKEAQKADRRYQAEVERAQRELEWSYTRRAAGGGDGRVGPLVLDDRLAEAPQMVGGLVLPPASEMQWVRELQEGLQPVRAGMVLRDIPHDSDDLHELWSACVADVLMHMLSD